MKENIIFGPVLIPNKKVFRQANINIPEEHYIFFSEETIKKLRENFHEKNYDNNVNINHNGIKVQGVFLTKSFIINNTQCLIKSLYVTLISINVLPKNVVVNGKLMRLLN